MNFGIEILQLPNPGRVHCVVQEAAGRIGVASYSCPHIANADSQWRFLKAVPAGKLQTL